jgi:DNA-directed RNA polymerase subunit RPC12/RpoP
MSAQESPSGGGMPPRPGGPQAPNKPPACPQCQRRMSVKQVAPVLFASALDDVIYGCDKCGTEVKRTFKRT